MSRHAWWFPVLLALVVLCACRAPGPRYVTALEAYDRVKPAMLAWHEDSIVNYMFSLPAERAELRIRTDGKASWWTFMVCSPSAKKLTAIDWLNGGVRVGTLEGGPISTPCDIEGVPLDSIIDSDQAIAIALENGAGPADTLLYIRTHHDRRSWELTFGELHDLPGYTHVLVDGVRGDITESDFTK